LKENAKYHSKSIKSVEKRKRDKTTANKQNFKINKTVFVNIMTETKPK